MIAITAAAALNTDNSQTGAYIVVILMGFVAIGLGCCALFNLFGLRDRYVAKGERAAELAALRPDIIVNPWLSPGPGAVKVLGVFMIVCGCLLVLLSGASLVVQA